MHIETVRQPAVEPITTTNKEWERFFEGFSTSPSDEEKQEIIGHFVHHLSHLIYEQTQRMINVYKNMREH